MRRLVITGWVWLLIPSFLALATPRPNPEIDDASSKISSPQSYQTSSTIPQLAPSKDPNPTQPKNDLDKLAETLSDKDDLQKIALDKIAETNKKFGLPEQGGYGTMKILWEGPAQQLPQEFIPIDKSQVNLGDRDMAVAELNIYDKDGKLLAQDTIHWGGMRVDTTTEYPKNDVYYVSEPYAKYGQIQNLGNGEVGNATMRVSRDPSEAVASPGLTTERLHADDGWNRGGFFGTAGCWGTRGSMTPVYNAVNTIQTANGKSPIPVYVSKAGV